MPKNNAKMAISIDQLAIGPAEVNVVDIMIGPKIRESEPTAWLTPCIVACRVPPRISE